MIASYYRSHI